MKMTGNAGACWLVLGGMKDKARKLRGERGWRCGLVFLPQRLITTMTFLLWTRRPHSRENSINGVGTK